jgi:NitT/TauT family transport system ATP-binding protein
VDVVDVDLPRPRNERLFAERRFHEYEDLIRQRLHRAWTREPREGAVSR